jgi:hypothetical protein
VLTRDSGRFNAGKLDFHAVVLRALESEDCCKSRDRTWSSLRGISSLSYNRRCTGCIGKSFLRVYTNSAEYYPKVMPWYHHRLCRLQLYSQHVVSAQTVAHFPLVFELFS